MCILSVSPLALEPLGNTVEMLLEGTSCVSDVSLSIRGKAGSAAMSVLGHQTAPGTITLVVSVPTMDAGISWIEAIVSTQSGPIVSDPWPLMITAHEGIADDLNQLHSDCRPSKDTLTFLSDLSSALYPDVDPEFKPALVVRAVGLGMAQVVEEIVYAAWDWFDNGQGELHGSPGTRNLLMAADDLGPGLLGMAIKSECTDTLATVIELLDQAHVSIDVCRLIDVEKEITLLHHAAAHASPDAIQTLLEKIKPAIWFWKHAKATEQLLTPADIMRARGIPFDMPDDKAERQQGSEIANTEYSLQGIRNIQHTHSYIEEPSTAVVREPTVSEPTMAVPAAQHWFTSPNFHIPMVVVYVVAAMMTERSIWQDIIVAAATCHGLHVLLMLLNRCLIWLENHEE